MMLILCYPVFKLTQLLADLMLGITEFHLVRPPEQ